MEKNLFHALTEEDIEVRAGKVTEQGLEMVLYKNATIDSMMLDEVFGPLNWKKELSVTLRPDNTEKIICVISVFNEKLNTWISKDGVGTETELFSEKGQETDAMKRAGFAWGIGRELKNKAPRLYFPVSQCNIKTAGFDEKGQEINVCRDRFVVQRIVYDNEDSYNRRIAAIVIGNMTTNNRLVWDIRDEIRENREKISKVSEPKPSPAVITAKPVVSEIVSTGQTESSSTQPEKRRRGRPRKVDVANAPVAPVVPANNPTGENIAVRQEARSVPSNVSADMLVTIGNFAKKETHLRDLLPPQLRWLFQNKEASDEMKLAILDMAEASPDVKKEFIKAGIAINAERMKLQ